MGLAQPCATDSNDNSNNNNAQLASTLISDFRVSRMLPHFSCLVLFALKPKSGSGTSGLLRIYPCDPSTTQQLQSLQGAPERGPGSAPPRNEDHAPTHWIWAGGQDPYISGALVSPVGKGAPGNFEVFLVGL